MVLISEEIKYIFQIKLLKWHKHNFRNFSWRKLNDPYGIIISEIMLQKTNAEKVDKILPDFLSKYPNIKTLSEAPTDELLNELQVLGLQKNKSIMLKTFSNIIIEKYNGKIPDNKNELIKLKGIGEYIANATLCFAFNKKVPIVDSNIIRILERLFNLRSSKKIPRLDKEIWYQTEELLPSENYKLFNYALLDFAALVCKSRSPLCNKCFMTEFCYYFKQELI